MTPEFNDVNATPNRGLIRDVSITSNATTFIDDVQVTSIRYWDAISALGHRFWFIAVTGIAVREKLPVTVNIPLGSQEWKISGPVHIPEHLR